MATPHVAGALALALSCAPTLSNADLRADLDASAQDLGVAGRDAKTGYGLARADLLVARACGVQPVNHPPVALFTATPAGLAVQFDGSASHDPDGDALSYAWTFGDGTPGGLGRIIAHNYAAAGTYVPTLTVSDGRNATTTSASVTVTAPAFAATFTPASGCNSWWVEVRVASSRPVAAVFATVDGGPRVALPKTSWGDWAKSFYVAKGSAVQFGATDSDGETVLSPVIPWLGAVDNSGAFTATITPRQTTNEWWVEVQVTSNHAVASVDARVGSGAWVSLPKDSWGTWAKSFYVAPGSTVTFRATDTAGATLTSATYVWS